MITRLKRKKKTLTLIQTHRSDRKPKNKKKIVKKVRDEGPERRIS
jgi:hypothetical protein